MPDVLPGEDVAVLEDRFRFVQAQRGWRFGIDAVMLAKHVLEGPHGDLLEIGTGCGVVAILLAGWGWTGKIVAVEIQPALADRARRNVLANGVGDAVTIIEGDARCLPDYLGKAAFRRVVSNPPYWRLGTGRTNPDPERAAARHELLMNVASLLRIARQRLSPDGVASILYPPERMSDVSRAAAEEGLVVTGTVDLLGTKGRPPEVVLLDLQTSSAPQPLQPSCDLPRDLRRLDTQGS
jgi:tRNA1Val (adenine37-N6)-methyltransferase